jgi:transposase
MLTVGIDVGASFHVAAFLLETPEPEDWKKLPILHIEQNIGGYHTLKSRVEEYMGPGGRPEKILGHYNGQVKIALEPTGRFYAESIAHFCYAQGWQVCWVENKTLHDYRSMMRSPSKSDAMDARLLAHYLHHNHTTVLEGDKYSKHLRYLNHELKHLYKQRTQYKNRLRQILKVTFPELEIGKGSKMLELVSLAPTAEQVASLEVDAINEVVKNLPLAIKLKETAQNSIGYNERFYVNRAMHNVRQILTLDERIQALEQDIEYLVDEHPDGEIVTSLPGVAQKVAAALIGTYGDINRYDNARQFKRRLGVAANVRESGTSVHSTFINRRSSKHARCALHMASIGCLHPRSGSNYFRLYFEAHRRDGIKGHNRRLLGRIKGKMAEVLYKLLKTREKYDPKKHQNLTALDM